MSDLQPATNRRRWWWRDDRGSESVELAILLPIGLLLVAMLVVGARIALAERACAAALAAPANPR